MREFNAVMGWEEHGRLNGAGSECLRRAIVERYDSGRSILDSLPNGDRGKSAWPGVMGFMFQVRST